MILQISTSVNLSAMARTTLLKTLSSNAAKAIQQPESALTVCLHSDAGIMVGGRFVSGLKFQYFLEKDM